ncbi:MAG: HD domain-containing protein [Eubacteriales bacterium]|nr:HD domain-containing protein [Eubacteriales bacterium]
MERELAKELNLKHRILDNVHGFIYYSDAEAQIMDELLFKRLQSIKQLSLANWIFPGSEHTRFVHSIGVMHIADRIAEKIGLNTSKRKVLRLAGLLHDIGHYPLSHVCEFPYKKKLKSYSEGTFCKDVNNEVAKRIDGFTIKVEKDFMVKANKGHHESVGALIIQNNDRIKTIIKNECGESAIDLICDMITGNVERVTGEDALLVQILHSELDADGIDYLRRDAAFSGTSFGSFELDQLINCMKRVDLNGSQILAIEPKGIAAADQYLINKFFSFSQVIFNKHIVILEWMAERIVAWMQEKCACFPEQNILLNEWLGGEGGGLEKYLAFNDNFFWNALQKTQESDFSRALPKFIQSLSGKLLSHQELKFIEGSEYKIISKSTEDIRNELQASYTYKELPTWTNNIAILNEKKITKHVTEEKFKTAFFESAQKENDDRQNASMENKDELTVAIKQDYQKALGLRLMEGICIVENGAPQELHLLCDDNRSLMRQLYDTTLVLLRAYKFED